MGLKSVQANKFKVLAGLIILALAWIGNLIYFYGQQLPEPLFFKHFYELNARGGVNFRINYLVNRSKELDVNYFEIPGLKYQPRQYPLQDVSFTHQILKKTHIEIADKELEQVMNSGELKITQLIAHLSNGETLEVPVGEIYIYRRSEDYLLHENVSSSSSDNTGYSVLEAKEPVTITEFKHRFEEQLGDSLILSLSRPGQEISFPVQLNALESVILNYEFLFNEADAYNYYAIEGQLMLEDQEGNKKSQSYRLHYEPYFNAAAVRKIVKTGRDF